MPWENRKCKIWGEVEARDMQEKEVRKSEIEGLFFACEYDQDNK